MTRSIKDETQLLGLDLWKTDICFDYLSSFMLLGWFQEH